MNKPESRLPLYKVGHYAYLAGNGVIILLALAFIWWLSGALRGEHHAKSGPITVEEFDKSLEWIKEQQKETDDQDH